MLGSLRRTLVLLPSVNLGTCLQQSKAILLCAVARVHNFLVFATKPKLEAELERCFKMARGLGGSGCLS